MNLLGEFQSLGPMFLFSLAIAIILVMVLVLVALYAYYQRRLRAAAADLREVADLAAERDRYAAEIDQAKLWQAEAKEEMLKLKAEREDQERLRSELNQAELAVDDAQQRADVVLKELLDNQYTVTKLREDQERLTREIEKDSLHAKQSKEEVQGLEKARDIARDEAQGLQKTVDKLTDEVRVCEEQLAQRKGDLETTESRRSIVAADIRNLEIRQASIQNEIARLVSELTTAQARLTRVQSDVEPIQEKIRERYRLENELKALQSSITELKDAKRDLEETQGLTISGTRYSDLFEVEPPCLADRVFPNGSLGSITEVDALKQVEQNLSEQSLFFPKRVLYAFHTCVKVGNVSAITVLAGISGTGKSELPLRYAEAMGMHSLPIAIQPSWSSPQDLFGFYNYLEKRYKATELARSLVRMDKYNFSGSDPAFAMVRKGSRADRLLLVLLDEMNLARIEYYFSEFLSKLEARRAVFDPKNRKDRAPAEIEIQGAQQSANDGRLLSQGIRLWVGPNVLFTGTMNEDESTQTLSDKVLDRANVLRFGKPPTNTKRRSSNNRSNKFVQERYLPYETWTTWIRPVSADSRWRRDVDKWFEQLNDALGGIGRPLGWRAKDAINEYVANYPGVEGGSEYKVAVADQVEQKVLPKLRGIDLTQERTVQALNLVESVLDDLGDLALLTAVKDCRHDTTYGTFNWRGVTRE